MKLFRSRVFWICTFTALFLLSIDIWAWERVSPRLFGLPYIILYTVFLEGLLFVAFFVFISTYWKDLKEES